ncbi:LytR/AlgR family response regulator transcription factor [Pontibacillus salicampi]|uniref:LytR/AlgR family response regulator transcription factor n=1 Tax=Pontibacillus salicampi TaxID=1449801 RepID=A0ABV6LII8_9BACI
MNDIRVMVVDDEVYSRDELVHLLSLFHDISIVEEAGSAEKALEKIMKSSIDVVFMDIEMGPMSGIDLVEAVQQLKHPPEIVFATAHPDYAAKAFRLQALDYLLKPFAEEEVMETVQRIRSVLAGDEQETQGKKKGKLAIESEDRIYYVHPDDIIFIRAEEGATVIHTRSKQIPSKTTLKEFQGILKSWSFFRTHKSFLINLEDVVELIPWFNGAYQLKLKDVQEDIPVSRTYAKDLKAKLSM